MITIVYRWYDRIIIAMTYKKNAFFKPFGILWQPKPGNDHAYSWIQRITMDYLLFQRSFGEDAPYSPKLHIDDMRFMIS